MESKNKNFLKDEIKKSNLRLGMISEINSDLPIPNLDRKTLRSIKSEADDLTSRIVNKSSVKSHTKNSSIVSPLRNKLNSVDPDDLEESASRISSIIKSKRDKIKNKSDKQQYEPEINETERYRLLNNMGKLKEKHTHINVPTNVQDVRLIREIYENTKEQVEVSNSLLIMRLGILGFFVISSWLGKKFVGDYMQNLIYIETILWPIYDKILLEIEDDPMTFPTIKINMSPMTKLMLVMLGSTTIYALLGAFVKQETIEGIFTTFGTSVSDPKVVNTQEIIPNILATAANKFGLLGLLTGKKPSGNEEMPDTESILSEISVKEN